MTRAYSRYLTSSLTDNRAPSCPLKPSNTSEISLSAFLCNCLHTPDPTPSPFVHTVSKVLSKKESFLESCPGTSIGELLVLTQETQALSIPTPFTGEAPVPCPSGYEERGDTTIVAWQGHRGCSLLCPLNWFMSSPPLVFLAL